VGVRTALIVRRETIDERYIDTAWTMLVVRGLLLTGTACLIAWPIAVYYEQPMLFGLIAVSSVAASITGFASPYQMLAQKNVRFGKLVLWRATSQTVAALIVVLWLLVWPTIWVLAVHRVIQASISTATSYYWFGDRIPRLRWDTETVREIFLFGRWIVVATALTYFAQQGDSLVVSSLLSVEQLGIFSIAIALAKLIETVVTTVVSALLVPAYAELKRGAEDRFRSRSARIRLGVLGLSLPPILLFSLFGRDIVELLYDSRYHDAGHILEIVAAGGVFFAASAGVIALPLAMGESKRHMWIQLARVLILFASMLAGELIAGFAGLIFGIALAHLWSYPVVYYFAGRRYGVTDARYEVLYVLSMVAVIASVWTLRGWPQPQ